MIQVDVCYAENRGFRSVVFSLCRVHRVKEVYVKHGFCVLSLSSQLY